MWHMLIVHIAVWYREAKAKLFVEFDIELKWRCGV